MLIRYTLKKDVAGAVCDSMRYQISIQQLPLEGDTNTVQMRVSSCTGLHCRTTERYGFLASKRRYPV